jgi:hypothetical protein
MRPGRHCFATLADATRALHRLRRPYLIIRFAPDPAESVVVGANGLATALSTMPRVGEHPDSRRDRQITADVELEYLYHQLVERGHARQVLSADGGALYELSIIRAAIGDDRAVYGFVSVREKGERGVPY